VANRITQWLERRRAAKRQRRHDAGFDYAAGVLLRSEGCPVDRLEDDIDRARCFNDFDDFDRGIEDALREASRWKPIFAK
jgi:hypothetical protein